LKRGIAHLLIEFIAPLRDLVYSQFDLCEKAYPGLAKRRPTPRTKGDKTTNAKVPSAPKSKGPPLTAAALDIRVGRIISFERVKDSEKLYVEQIDVGETKPRQIVSGLAQHIPIEQMQNRVLLVMCNLKAAKLVGVLSEGMVLAASNADKSSILLVDVPSGANIGERITFPGLEDIKPDEPIISNARLKKILKDLHVDENGIAMHRDKPFTTSAGVCTSSLKGGVIS